MLFRFLLLLCLSSQLCAYTFPDQETLTRYYRGKNVLVTGGYGFIGSHITEQLVALGAHVTVFDKRITNNLDHVDHTALKIVQGTIADAQLCLQATQDIDIIFHLAAFVSVPLSMEQPRNCFEDNVQGTFNLLEAARINGVKQFILSSTSAAYGTKNGACSEDMLCSPESPYGFSKLIDELLCKQYNTCYGLSTLCLRYFNVYGERQNPHAAYAAVFARFNYHMERDEAVTIFGDGQQTRDFVTVQDVALCNLSLALLPQEYLNGQVINVGSGSSINVHEVFRLVKQNYPDYDHEPVYAAARSGDVKDTAARCDKLVELLAIARDNL